MYIHVTFPQYSKLKKYIMKVHCYENVIITSERIPPHCGVPNLNTLRPSHRAIRYDIFVANPA